jgi:hypothetical protein
MYTRPQKNPFSSGTLSNFNLQKAPPQKTFLLLRNLIPALHNTDKTGAQHPPEHDADAIQRFQQELGHHRLRKHDGGGDGHSSHVRPEAADPEARPSHREGRRFVRVKFVQMKTSRVSELSESKPEMKDTSTQTTPHSSNNMLNSSQEHLPKINNNCNVGNGPIALLPGVQIKDFNL